MVLDDRYGQEVGGGGFWMVVGGGSEVSLMVVVMEFLGRAGVFRGGRLWWLMGFEEDEKC